MVKKILICLISISLFSCSINDDNYLSTHQELLAIENVTMPEEFERGTVYEIVLTYFKPTNCHTFYDIYYVKNDNERTVAVISSVIENQNCTITDDETEVSFNFEPTDANSYIFKFWQGEDENNEDIYLEMEIPVVN